MTNCLRAGGCAGSNYPFLTQKERDNETGLDYFLARYYSSTQGRFTSVDPEQAGARNDDPQSWNGYAYGRNNPMVYTDPDGRTYTVCDPNGKNCVEYRDAEFEKLKKGGPADGYTFKKGKIYYNGELTGTYSHDSLYSEQLINEMGRRAPLQQKLILAFGAVNLAPAVGIVTADLLAGGAALTTLGNLSRTAGPAATGAGGVLSQMSQRDAAIFQRAAEFGLSKANSFYGNLEALTRAVVEKVPGGRLDKIGQIGNSPVFGSGRSGVGIAEVQGQTVVVKMVHGNPQILGQLPK